MIILIFQNTKNTIEDIKKLFYVRFNDNFRMFEITIVYNIFIDLVKEYLK